MWLFWTHHVQGHKHRLPRFVSFARDAETLIDAGFGLDWIDVVDQFRWSPHTELVASFTRT